MKENQALIIALATLADEFHLLEVTLDKNGQGPDGIIKSITITLDKLLYAVSNNHVLDESIKRDFDKCSAVVIRAFEGSGIDDDLFRIKELIINYNPG